MPHAMTWSMLVKMPAAVPVRPYFTALVLPCSNGLMQAECVYTSCSYNVQQHGKTNSSRYTTAYSSPRQPAAAVWQESVGNTCSCNQLFCLLFTATKVGNVPDDSERGTFFPRVGPMPVAGGDDVLQQQGKFSDLVQVQTVPSDKTPHSKTSEAHDTGGR